MKRNKLFYHLFFATLVGVNVFLFFTFRRVNAEYSSLYALIGATLSLLATLSFTKLKYKVRIKSHIKTK